MSALATKGSRRPVGASRGAYVAPGDSLDAAVEEVCAAMKADRTKSRLTFYYLLAERFGKLDAFAAKGAKGAA